MATGQEISIADRFTQIAKDSITRGKYSDALEYAGNALVNCIAVHGLGSAKTADSHLLLGRVYLLLNDYTNAITEIRVGRTIRRQLFGEKSLDCAMCDLFIGQAEYGLGNFQRAFHYYFTSLYKRRSLVGDDHQLSREALSYVQHVRGKQSSLGNSKHLPGQPSGGRQDQWVHKYEIYDRLVELQWKQKNSDSLMFKLSVSLQYSLLSEQNNEPCFLLSRLRKVVREAVISYLGSKALAVAQRGKGRAGSIASTLSSIPRYSTQQGHGLRDDVSDSGTECSGVDSANAPETAVAGSVIRTEGSGPGELLVTANNIDESVANIIALLQAPSSSFASERLMLVAATGVVDRGAQQHPSTLLTANTRGRGGASTMPSPGGSETPKSASMLRASSSSSYFQSPGTPPGATGPHTASLSGMMAGLTVTAPPPQFHLPSPTFLMSRTEEDVDAEEEEAALDDFVASVKEGREELFEAEHAPLTPPVALMGSPSGALGGAPRPPRTPPPQAAAPTPEFQPPRPSQPQQQASPAKISQPVPNTALYPPQPTRVPAPTVVPGSPPLSYTATKPQSGPNNRAKLYPSNMSLEVGRLNTTLADRNINLPKFGDSQALSIDELLAMSAKATAEQRAKNPGEAPSIADDLHGDWVRKRMPFRLLPHQAELETLDVDGRRVLVHHAGADAMAASATGPTRPVLTNDSLKDRLQCMSATLVVAWLRARKKGLDEAAAVAATTPNPSRNNNNRLASFVRGSIRNKGTAEGTDAAKTAAEAAKAAEVEAAKGKKTEKIPRPPPLPRSWPPDFDNLDGPGGDTGRGTKSAAGVGALFGAAKKVEPPKVKQIQWDAIGSAEGTLWEDVSVAELVDPKALFETVETDFSTSKPKTVTKFGGGGGGGPMKFSAADMLKGAGALSKGKSTGGAGGGAGADGKPKAAALLDINRAQNLNIMLAKFGRIDLRDLATAVHRLDMKPPLDISAVTALQQFIPTADEIKLIGNHIKGDNHKELVAGLGKAEKYILEMGRVPMLDQRLGVMWFCMSLRETLNQLEHSAQVMLTATGEVRGSVRLKCILRVILELGNILKNDGVITDAPAKNSPAGFRFTSLPKIIVTKSNKGENVLEYIVGRLHTAVPEMLQIDTDMPSANEAVHVSFAKLSMELGKLKSGLQTLKDLLEHDRKFEETADQPSTEEEKRTPATVLQRMEEMVRDFTAMIAGAEKSFNESQKDFEDTLVYLGETLPTGGGPNPLTPDVIFGQMCTFIKSVEVANNATIAKLKRQARQIKH